MRNMRNIRKLIILAVLPALTGVICVLGIDKTERRIEKNALEYKRTLEDSEEGAEKEYLTAETTEQSEGEKQKQKEKSHTDISDEEYDGYIDCLLEIPKINMCRIVITGGNVKDNLSNHYFTAARSSMSYGEGSYVIFGHQSFTRNKGMNRIDELVSGDLIYISGEGFQDIYEVTEILDSHEGEAVEDFNAGSGHLALYTCKKQHEGPKPYVIIRAVKRS